MIFVTVGMHNKGFNRLVEMMDDIASRIQEEVIIQIGCSSYLPKNTQYFNFTDNETLFGYFSDARIIVSHAGAGTIIDSLLFEKPLILVPREMKYGECFDNQQFELASMLKINNRAFIVFSKGELECLINNQNFIRIEKIENDRRLIQYLKEIIT
jgi:beta-1,4-N-acetylglucosaminyltransferase